MPNLDFTHRIEITPEKFINACSMAELMELDMLLSKKLEHVTEYDVNHSEQTSDQNSSPFILKQKDKNVSCQENIHDTKM